MKGSGRFSKGPDRFGRVRTVSQKGPDGFQRVRTGLEGSGRFRKGPDGLQRVPTGLEGSRRVRKGPDGFQRVRTGLEGSNYSFSCSLTIHLICQWNTFTILAMSCGGRVTLDVDASPGMRVYSQQPPVRPRPSKLRTGAGAAEARPRVESSPFPISAASSTARCCCSPLLLVLLRMKE